MKKELFIVGIVGIFLTSSLLSASASNPVKMSDEIPHVDNNYDGMQTSYHETNTADFGVMGSINREKSFGAAIVSEKPLLEANWIAKQNEASGYLTMTIANFIQNESGETLNNYRLSTYRITVHDGPSTSDPVLFTDEKEVLENAGDMISDLIFPVTIDTKGQSSRELAVERTAQTQLVSNIFQMPMKGKEGLETKTTAFHVTFVSPASVEKNTDSPPALQTCSPSSDIMVYLGTIEIYTEMGESNHPRISTNGIPDEPIHIPVNISEDVEITAILNISIDLPSAPHPHKFLRFLGCKAIFSLDGGYPYNGGTKSAKVSSMQIPLIESNLHKQSQLFCNMTVNTGDTDDVLFLPACSFAYYPICIWDFFTPWDSFEGKFVTIKFD